MTEEVNTQPKKQPMTLQVDIIKRGMTPEQWDKFWDEYRGHRKNMRTSDRAESLSQTITQLEQDCLVAYLDNTDVSIKELSAELNLPEGSLYHHATRAAFKYLYQNRNVLSYK